MRARVTTLTATLVVVALGLLCVSVHADGDPSAPMPGIVSLTEKSFKELVGKGRGALVEVYAPWCGHCKAMAAEYARLGAAYEASPKAQEHLIIGKIDATVEKALSTRLGVKGFPTVLYFPPNSAKDSEDYTGERSAEAFAEFLRDKESESLFYVPQEPDYVVEMNADEFDDKVISDASKSVLVMFYAPWCGHCKTLKPLYNKLAYAFRNEPSVVIARVNGDAKANEAIAQKYEVTGFPKVMLFPRFSHNEPEEYQGERDLNAMLTYMNKKAYTFRTATGDVDSDYGLVDQLSLPLNKMIKHVKNEKKLLSRYDSFLKAGKGMGGESVQYYVKLAKRVMQDRNTDFLKTESARLNRILEASGDAKVSGSRRDFLSRRRNILDAVLNRRVADRVNDQ